MTNKLVNHKKNFVYLILVLYWIILFGATSIPADSVPTTGVGDKIEHFLAYFILSILLAVTFHLQNKFGVLRKHYLLSTFIIATIYGVIDELHQLLVPGRRCEFLDWLSDAGGVLLGLIFFLSVLKRFLIGNFIKNSIE